LARLKSCVVTIQPGAMKMKDAPKIVIKRVRINTGN